MTTDRKTDKQMGGKRIDEWWRAASVELDEDERVRYRGQILRGTLAWGELFLTTKRLIWIRTRIALPLGRKLIEVPLSDIESWSIERAPWWMLHWWGRRRGIVRIRTAFERFDFVTAWTREDADEWAEALENVMAGAGIVKGEAHA